MKKRSRYTFRAKVWLWRGNGAWYFATLPKTLSNKIKILHGFPRRGWGALPVNVTVGKTGWKTSIFPYSVVKAYILPLKADVRKKEKIIEGRSVHIAITLHQEE